MRRTRRISLGAVILAAGSSSRMGRPKMLLRWGETTVLGHLIGVWERVPADQVAVVCSPADAAISTELDRLQFPTAHRIVNPDPSRGMFSSIQCAARWSGWKQGLTHWAVILGDQPHLRLETLCALVDFAGERAAKTCQPRMRAHGRHPVILPAETFFALKDSNATTLKEFLQREATDVQQIELNDPGLDLDLDHPADYENALRLVFGGKS